jgi:site-specific recombinase XerD
VLARKPDTLPRNVLTPQEARKIIELPDTGALVGHRDRIILEVLCATGFRKVSVTRGASAN